MVRLNFCLRPSSFLWRKLFCKHCEWQRNKIIKCFLTVHDSALSLSLLVERARCHTKFIRQINFNCSSSNSRSTRGGGGKAGKQHKTIQQQICGCRFPYLSVAPFSCLSSGCLFPHLVRQKRFNNVCFCSRFSGSVTRKLI